MIKSDTGINPTKRSAKAKLIIDCETVVFFLKISKDIGKVWRKSLTRKGFCQILSVEHRKRPFP